MSNVIELSKWYIDDNFLNVPFTLNTFGEKLLKILIYGTIILFFSIMWWWSR